MSLILCSLRGPRKFSVRGAVCNICSFGPSHCRWNNTLDRMFYKMTIIVYQVSDYCIDFWNLEILMKYFPLYIKVYYHGIIGANFCIIICRCLVGWQSNYYQCIHISDNSFIPHFEDNSDRYFVIYLYSF